MRLHAQRRGEQWSTVREQLAIQLPIRRHRRRPLPGLAPAVAGLARPTVAVQSNPSCAATSRASEPVGMPGALSAAAGSPQKCHTAGLPRLSACGFPARMFGDTSRARLHSCSPSCKTNSMRRQIADVIAVARANHQRRPHPSRYANVFERAERNQCRSLAHAARERLP